MKRAGGGFDPCYNAQTAVDDTAHIIVAAEVGNNAADVGQNCCRCCRRSRTIPVRQPSRRWPMRATAAKPISQAWQAHPRSWWLPLDARGQTLRRVDAQRNPHTAEMVQKLQTDEGKAAYRRRKWLAEPPNGWIKNVLGVPTVQPARPAPGASRVQARLHGVESAPDGQHACRLRAHRCEKPTRTASRKGARTALWAATTPREVGERAKSQRRAPNPPSARLRQITAAHTPRAQRAGRRAGATAARRTSAGGARSGRGRAQPCGTAPLGRLRVCRCLTAALPTACYRDPV
jgi:hypothetical protein